MKNAQQWFDEYGESHKNGLNKTIHWICVPAIFFSIIGLLASIPHGFFNVIFPEEWHAYVHFGTIGLLIALLFYIRMSIPLFIGMTVFSALVIYGNALIQASDWVLWQVSLIIFIAAWVGQFIGHKIEGKKPSFFKDLQFLLIGPAWLMHFIYKKLGLGY